MLPEWLNDATNQIDAGLFSGDTFYDEFYRNFLKSLLGRWQRRITEIENEAKDG